MRLAFGSRVLLDIVAHCSNKIASSSFHHRHDKLRGGKVAVACHGAVSVAGWIVRVSPITTSLQASFFVTRGLAARLRRANSNF